MIKKKNISKKIFFLAILIYLICVFINQQKTLNQYGRSQKYYKAQIEEKLAYQKDLQDTKSNLNSKEYIEKIAREKLDMYLPNERVYLDKGK